MIFHKAPFPWFGGKRKVSNAVWSRFGDVAVYAEPFAGSLAVLLGRPGEHEARVETVNDKDGFVCNAWRAILHDPCATAHHADWPANECDLHARHAWLTERRSVLATRLEGDPEYYDSKIAGWWLWGLSQWIGGEFCSGKGPWSRVEVAPGDYWLVREKSENSIPRQIIHLGSAGQGVKNRQGKSCLERWLQSLSDRLRYVRVCCGDWKRILTPSALCSGNGIKGIFLDPPYSAESGRDRNLYTVESGSVAHNVREWCLSAPGAYRIALCGYAGEGHEELERFGWRVYSWCAKGGMSKDRGKGSGGNNERERIWFSPACLADSQPTALGRLAMCPDGCSEIKQTYRAASEPESWQIPRTASVLRGPGLW